MGQWLSYFPYLLQNIGFIHIKSQHAGSEVAMRGKQVIVHIVYFNVVAFMAVEVSAEKEEMVRLCATAFIVGAEVGVLAIKILHFICFFFPEGVNVFCAKAWHEQFGIVYKRVVFYQCGELGFDPLEKPYLVSFAGKTMFQNVLPEVIPEVNADLEAESYAAARRQLEAPALIDFAQQFLVQFLAGLPELHWVGLHEWFLRNTTVCTCLKGRESKNFPCGY